MTEPFGNEEKRIGFRPVCNPESGGNKIDWLCRVDRLERAQAAALSATTR